MSCTNQSDLIRVPEQGSFGFEVNDHRASNSQGGQWSKEDATVFDYTRVEPPRILGFL